MLNIFFLFFVLIGGNNEVLIESGFCGGGEIVVNCISFLFMFLRDWWNVLCLVVVNELSGMMVLVVLGECFFGFGIDVKGELGGNFLELVECLRRELIWCFFVIFRVIWE